MSVASTTLLENIVVRVKSWAVLLRLPHCSATLGKTHVAELCWLPRCCSNDKDASILVAPDFAAKKRRQCYAYRGGGQFN